MAACADQNPKHSDQFLIRVENRVLTLIDYNKAFELTKIAYPHNLLRDPAALRTIRSRLLSQLTEELILLERAKEMNIHVSEAEVEKAVSDIRKDYPDEVFEQTLLENAISYGDWRRALRVRLLKEKVVERELADQVSITTEDISEYIKNHFTNGNLDSGLTEGSADMDEIIIHHIRRQKAEEAYSTWINKLRNKYVIEINRDLWEKITGS